MNFNFDNKKMKKAGIIFCYIVIGLYALFLVSPLILSPIANSYRQHVEDLIKTSTGFDSKIDGLGIVTSPKLGAGIKIKDFSLSIPASEEPFFKAQNFKVTLAVLPLIIKRVQLESISVKSIDGQLIVKKDGSFLVEDYIIQSSSESEPMVFLPNGLKLSNHLPNISAGEYKLSFADAMDGKSYYIQGEKFNIADFILDKKIKLSTKGKIVLNDSVISNYDVKIYNKIMPKLQLEDLIFPKDITIADNDTYKKNNTALPFNIIEIFKTIYKNELRADITTDIKTSGTLKNPDLKGHLKVDAMSVAVNGNKLPESYADLTFIGNKTDIDSIFFTSTDENEKTQIIGDIHTGQRPSIDLTFRSNAKFNNFIRLIDSVAQSFGLNDFKTLSASGGIDADFNINSDMKKVSSTGYLKINQSKVSYGLYNVVIDKITADIDLMNNNVNIRKAGFSILGHPLKLSGTIEANSNTNLRLFADKLSVKGLLTAFGQTKMLKENDINSGTLSLNTVIKGRLDNLKPDVKIIIEGVDIWNKASAAKLSLSDALIKIIYNNKTLTGDVDISSMILQNASASVSIPKIKVVMDSKNVNINDSYLLLNNSRVDFKGIVKDYTSNKMTVDMSADGNVASADIAAFIPTDIRFMFPYAGKLPIVVTLKGNSKVQDVSLNLIADDSNYLKLADIDLLKGKTTKILANMKILSDNLTFSNSGIYSEDKTVVKLDGGISKLSSKPQLNLSISVPKSVSFPIWGMNNSNITFNGSVSIIGDMLNPQVKGSLNLSDISVKDMDFVLSDLIVHMNGPVLNGNAAAKKFKMGGIVGENITSKFSFVNYKNFYLSDLSADAFDGKINGKISYNVITSAIGVDLTGKDLNSTNTVYGATGIKNALTGALDFDAKLSMQGLTDKDIIRSMKGNVTFNIEDGRFMNIGRLENLVAAQNISSNSVLRAAIASLSTLATIQEANKFKTITGYITLSNGAANIKNIRVTGPLMAYHVNGTYNILPNTANLIILGRLEGKVVSCLGVLGELSAEKLLSYIPKFGALTANILNQLTTDPANENTALIPALSSGSTIYKDFKVVFNGPVESSSSVRYFKWLSTCDTTPIDMKKELQNAKESVKTNVTNRVENAKTNAQNVKNNIEDIVETQKNKVESAKRDFEQTKADVQRAKENAKQSSEKLKNLLKNAVKNSQTRMPETKAPVSSGDSEQ